MIRHMRHGSPPRLMALQSILSPNRRESLPTPSAGVRIIQREAGRATQRTDNGALFFCCFPRKLVRPARVVLAVARPALTPLADRLGRDAIALRQGPGWLP